MASVADYRVVAMRAEGYPREKVRVFKGAPNDSVIASWLRNAQNPFDVAVRYMPSRKGWVVIDARFARSVMTTHGHPYWKGVTKSKTIYPSEAAALMKATFMLWPPTQHMLPL